MSKRRIVTWLVLAVLISTGISAQDGEVRVLPVQGNIHVIFGAGGNIAVQAGTDGVLLVDSGLEDAANKVMDEVRRISEKPIRRIINTHIHPDHTGGNAKLAEAGLRMEALIPRPQNVQIPQGAVVMAHGNVLNRMAGAVPGEAAVGSPQWPETTWLTPKKEVFLNDEAIEIIHLPNAHTDGDSIVFFRRSDVISTGDIFIKNLYPVIDLQRGGTINGLIDALNRIIDITIPRERQEGGTMVIPGHGRICDEDDVVNYRDMATIIRDRIQDMIRKGMTLQQVKQAKPTLDYDPLYGATTGFWTTDMFVEAVYASLSQGNKK
jgi:glyoxylase-like metal-dependent hydrolase (beta-lactamase superfamily II)